MIWPLRLATILLAALFLAAGLLALFSWRVARRMERLVPPRGRLIDVSGRPLHVVDRGEGPPILMIHGLSGTTGHFTHSLAPLLEADHRVVVVDRPGSGWSPRAGRHGLRAHAQAIADLIDTLGLDRPLIVGHSLGGAVALTLALNHPDKIRGLALLAPLAQFQPARHGLFRAAAIRSPLARALIGWTLAVPVGLLGAAQGMRLAYGPETPPPHTGIRAGGLLSLRPASFIATSAELMAAAEELPSLTARYAGLSLPVSVMFGTGDQVLDPHIQIAALRARIPQLQATLAPGGHMLPVTRAPEIARWLRPLAKDAPGPWPALREAC